MDDDDMKMFCPNCCQPYFLQFTSSKLKCNWPLFLPCGHSMCENCVTGVIRCSEPLECKVCFVDAVVTNTEAKEVLGNKVKLHQKFPINVHMVGELTLNFMKGSESIQKKPEEDPFLDLKTILKDKTAEGNCLECHEPTTKMCKQCDTVMCTACFKRSHMNFIIFKNHKLQPIEATLEPITCKVHKEKKLDYFCKDCKKAICMDCMMVGGEKSCKNHDVVPLQEVNETFFEELSELSPKVDEIFRRLTKTAVDIGYLLHNYDTDTGSPNDIAKIVENVDHHFSKLCSVVQKHKDEIMKIIKLLKSSEKDSLHRAKMEVSNAIKKAKSVLNMITIASDTQKINQINVPALLEEAKSVIDTPWYLNRKESDHESLKVLVNDDLCTLINDYVHLEGNVKSLYKLYTPSELGDDVEIPPPPVQAVFPPELIKDVRTVKKPKVEKENQKGQTLFQNVPKYRSKSGSVSSLNSVSSENSSKSYITPNNSYQQPIVQPVSPFAESQHPQQLRDGSQEIVYISHIMDPHNFFVQRISSQTLIKDMVREFRNAGSFAKPSVNHIVPGKTYLVYNKADYMWQRCRVINVDMKELNKPIIQVFCFDFGSTEYVSFDKLRLLPPSKIQCPYPLAINCSLANCVPISGAWTSDDSFLIQHIIDNKQAVIHVRRVIPISHVDFKLECDVTTFEHGVSIAHALVFHERAKMPNPKEKYPAVINGKEKPKLYMNNNDFKCDSPELVTITHVVSPDNFFVRKNHLQDVYEKLTEDMEQEYSLVSNDGTVYLPEIGMVCAVNVEKHAVEGAGQSRVRWARGVVRALAGRGRLRVLLPDTGRALLLHWHALRYLRHKHTTLSALATECHLAGITPYNKKWSTASVDLLQQYEGKVLELQAEDNRNRDYRSRGSVGVTLYDRTDNDNVVCINNEMIRHKFAITFGVYGFNKDLVEEQVVTNKSPLHEPSPPKPKQEKITILSRNDTEKKVKHDTSDELEAKDKGPLKLEARILHYQSPSHIYVSLIQQEKSYNAMFANIQDYFAKNKNQSKDDWKVGDNCCALCIQSQTWRRAVIIELESENAKLFYSDFAVIETVPQAGLRELPPEFASLGNAAMKCHLHGIMPAVGQEWPSLTKEYLKELLDAYKRIFITILGNFTDKSMPIEIWVYHTTQGSALEANKSEWRCLNKKIVEQGLGVPDKSQVTPEKKDEDLSDTLSFLNITGSVNDWLQLDPIPMVPLKTLMEDKADDDIGRITPVSIKEGEENAGAKERTEQSNVMYITDWLPPEPLSNKEFKALPTYIDNNGIVYLHDVSQNDTLDLIRKALDVRFKKPDPKARYNTWTVGEPCVALFFLDSRYYRGRVLQVNKEDSTCLIHYIDYGNEELCSFENLRKSVPLHQIPTQAHKCVLNRIRPVGKQWDRQTLDYIHKSVVEKQCLVEISGEEINGVTPIELKFDKLWINDHLVDFEMAEYADGTPALVKKFAPSSHDITEKKQKPNIEMDSAVNYSEKTEINSDYITYPNNIPEEFMCNITIVNDINTLQLNIDLDDDTAKVYDDMFEALQTESPNMTPLEGIFENKACVAIFPEDGRWYRASILQYSEAKNLVKVRYVDYGNIDVVSRNDTREINEEWVNLLPATVPAKLYGVQVNPELKTSVVTEAYTKTFLDQGPFHAKVVSQNDSVPFVELRRENKELVYKNLIEDNIFIQSK
ncbi:unnamed protein product [Chrysodeixis includens]|uniref:RING finger protein 17 n=1 Tax=Chrysodeixis includens TaxID=689277 RepID=A0A9P0FSF1_CHRIL|nr:unnamed protein product [Chrysodeixis includens]